MTHYAYWNLTEPPFQNTTDVRFAYLSDQHREGLARLMFLTGNQKLGGLLVGPYGVGKSMIIELLKQELDKDKNSAWACLDAVPGDTLSFGRQLVKILCPQEKDSHFYDTASIIAMLGQRAEKNRHTVIILDEAQNIESPAIYQFLHLLVNITRFDPATRRKLPAHTLLLSGHNTLLSKINAVPSLCQRLQLVWTLEPLTQAQITEYIQKRIQVAGGDIWTFDESALSIIGKSSQGIPRVINNICDVGLFLGFAARARQISEEIARQAVSEVQSPLLNTALPTPENKEEAPHEP